MLPRMHVLAAISAVALCRVDADDPHSVGAAQPQSLPSCGDPSLTEEEDYVSLMQLRTFNANLKSGQYRGYSQFGQDQWVLEQFANTSSQSARYFFDIGARDGALASNTLMLEENGWTGVCIEPFPSNFSTRKCSVVQKCVSAVEGSTQDFRHCTEENWLGGLDSTMGTHKKEVSSCPLVKVITTTIRSVLQRQNAPKVIDYVSLDIEGAEMLVLETFPFEDYCAQTWTIEHNNEEPKRTDMRKLLAKRGCSVAKSVDVDDFFTCKCV